MQFNKYTHTHTHTILPWEDQCEWHRMTRMTGPECAVMFNLINAQTHTHITNTYTPRVIPINSGSCCFCCCCYYLLPHVQRSQQQTECKSHAPISLTNHKQTSWCHLLLRVTPAYIRRKDPPPSQHLYMPQNQEFRDEVLITSPSHQCSVCSLPSSLSWRTEV